MLFSQLLKTESRSAEKAVISQLSTSWPFQGETFSCPCFLFFLSLYCSIILWKVGWVYKEQGGKTAHNDGCWRTPFLSRFPSAARSVFCALTETGSGIEKTTQIVLHQTRCDIFSLLFSRLRLWMGRFSAFEGVDGALFGHRRAHHVPLRLDHGEPRRQTYQILLDAA